MEKILIAMLEACDFKSCEVHDTITAIKIITGIIVPAKVWLHIDLKKYIFKLNNRYEYIGLKLMCFLL